MEIEANIQAKEQQKKFQKYLFHAEVLKGGIINFKCLSCLDNVQALNHEFSSRHFKTNPFSIRRRAFIPNLPVRVAVTGLQG